MGYLDIIAGLEAAQNNQYTTKPIPIIALKENPHNKEIYVERDLIELILDIKKNGLRQPLEVLEVEENIEYRIIAGNSRFKAIKAILEEDPTFANVIPCNVYYNLTEDEEVIMLITSNSTQRERSIKEILKEIKEFKRISENINKNNINGADPGSALSKYLADILKLGERQIRRYNKIESELSEDWIDELDKGAINIKTGYQLAQLSPEDQQVLLSEKQKIKSEENDQKEYNQTALITEAEVKSYKDKIKALEKKNKDLQEDLEGAEAEKEAILERKNKELNKANMEKEEALKSGKNPLELERQLEEEKKKIESKYEEKIKALEKKTKDLEEDMENTSTNALADVKVKMLLDSTRQNLKLLMVELGSSNLSKEDVAKIKEDLNTRIGLLSSNNEEIKNEESN